MRQKLMVMAAVVIAGMAAAGSVMAQPHAHKVRICTGGEKGNYTKVGIRSLGYA